VLCKAHVRLFWTDHVPVLLPLLIRDEDGVRGGPRTQMRARRQGRRSVLKEREYANLQNGGEEVQSALEGEYLRSTSVLRRRGCDVRIRERDDNEPSGRIFQARVVDEFDTDRGLRDLSPKRHRREAHRVPQEPHKHQAAEGMVRALRKGRPATRFSSSIDSLHDAFREPGDTREIIKIHHPFTREFDSYACF